MLWLKGGICLILGRIWVLRGGQIRELWESLVLRLGLSKEGEREIVVAFATRCILLHTYIPEYSV